VWPEARVVALVNEWFIPARLHAKDQSEDFRKFGDRFGASWTPTALMLDPSGAERHRIEGFRPLQDFLAHLTLGLGLIAFHEKRFKDADRRFGEVLEQFPESDAAPAAQYWDGVSLYKDSGDAKALAATAGAFQRSYQDSVWAKKASVWRSP
jgi:hypothetical protein